MPDNCSTILTSLFDLRKRFKNEYPTPRSAAAFIEASLAAIFPHFGQCAIQNTDQLCALVRTVKQTLSALCAPILEESKHRDDVVEGFVGYLPTLHQMLREDAEAIYKEDPAAHSVDEIILSYPGFFAIAVYRMANWLLSHHVNLIPRLMTECAHARTGIDIHPGATIGRSFVIDHGTGVVIGETCCIHDNVKLYQGVTLGALSVDKTFSTLKRHPTIENNVVIYANATILGGDTIVGAGSIIGGNVWLTTSVPPASRVYHRAEITVKS